MCSLRPWLASGGKKAINFDFGITLDEKSKKRKELLERSKSRFDSLERKFRRFRGDAAKNRRITCIRRRVMSISFRDLNLGPNVVYYFLIHQKSSQVNTSKYTLSKT